MRKLHYVLYEDKADHDRLAFMWNKDPERVLGYIQESILRNGHRVMAVDSVTVDRGHDDDNNIQFLHRTVREAAAGLRLRLRLAPDIGQQEKWLLEQFESESGPTYEVSMAEVERRVCEQFTATIRDPDNDPDNLGPNKRLSKHRGPNTFIVDDPKPQLPEPYEIDPVDITKVGYVKLIPGLHSWCGYDSVAESEAAVFEARWVKTQPYATFEVKWADDQWHKANQTEFMPAAPSDYEIEHETVTLGQLKELLQKCFISDLDPVYVLHEETGECRAISYVDRGASGAVLIVTQKKEV